MAKISKGDYVIVKPEGATRCALMKVRNADKEELIAVNEGSKIENKRVTATIGRRDVLLNLGDKPQYGRVYGLLVEPLISVKEIPNWGELHNYRRLDKAERKDLERAFAVVWKDVVKHGIQQIVPLIFETRHKQGRWAGYYKQHEEGNHITLKPTAFTIAETVHLIRHEIGHAVYFPFVPARYKVKWLKMYANYIHLNTVQDKTIQNMRKKLVKAGSIAECKNTLKDDEEEDSKKKVSDIDVFGDCLGFVRGEYNFDNDEIDLLLDSGDDLKAYWPRHAFDIADDSAGNSVMTEYGLTEPAEFFAEAFRMHLEGKSPKKLKKLMLKTLGALTK